MIALLQLQWKDQRTMMLVIVLLSFFMLNGQRFSINLLMVLCSTWLIANLSLQKVPIRHMLLTMPFSRRQLMNSTYVFSFCIVFVMSLISLVTQVYAWRNSGDLFDYLTVFIFVFSFLLVTVAFQLLFYFIGSIENMATIDMYLSFFLALCLVIAPMALLSLWSPYAILIGPIWSGLIVWLTYRSAAKHFEHKEIAL